MKIYLMTDLEGVAGVSSFDAQTTQASPYFEQARALLTAEVNAAVEGCLAAGADDILVADGHGWGGVVFEQLHPEAKLYHGRPVPSLRVFFEIARDYDVCMMIGQHAMAGVPTANMNHTGCSKTVDRVTLNGRLIGEIASFALAMGAYQVPLIYLSGDADACDEAESVVPRIVTSRVKQGVSRNSAISLSTAKARELIRHDVARAIEHHRGQPIEPTVWPGPYELDRRFFHTDTADAAAAQPHVQRVDAQTVRIQTDDILDAVC